VKEDGVIIAPVPEVSIHTATPHSLMGKVSFLDEFGPETPQDPPDLEYFCHLKGVCGGRSVRELVDFILQKLLSLPVEESLLKQPFRQKSSSSAINKMFYRGKSLTDLLATTVGTNSGLARVKKELSQRGAISVDEDQRVNGNGDLTYRFVRILRVELELEGSPQPCSFTFPVYYEVIKTRHVTPVPHKEYELTRLKFNLDKGQRIMLRLTGFTMEPLISSDAVGNC
jgi:hypothetical protein